MLKECYLSHVTLAVPLLNPSILFSKIFIFLKKNVNYVNSLVSYCVHLMCISDGNKVHFNLIRCCVFCGSLNAFPVAF